jgi:hypothetical protein
MFEPTAVTVAGRGKLVGTAQPDECGVTVRLDDERRPDWWAEVRLTGQQLADLLGQVRLCEEAMAAPCDGEEADALGSCRSEG